MKEHSYSLNLEWTGNLGTGTRKYAGYSRNHTVAAGIAPVILSSSDPAFRGDPDRWSPELLFVASIAQCHMLWYLHLASTAGIEVDQYSDQPSAVMIENEDGSGQFQSVTLHPMVRVADPTQSSLAHALHHQVASKCFIARSVQVPIDYVTTVQAV